MRPFSYQRKAAAPATIRSIRAARLPTVTRRIRLRRRGRRARVVRVGSVPGSGLGVSLSGGAVADG